MNDAAVTVDGAYYAAAHVRRVITEAIDRVATYWSDDDRAACPTWVSDIAPTAEEIRERDATEYDAALEIAYEIAISRATQIQSWEMTRKAQVDAVLPPRPVGDARAWPLIDVIRDGLRSRGVRAELPAHDAW